MRFIADLHLHSRYARATSRSLSPETLFRWCQIKGLDVVGTGDFTHPLWLDELEERLEPAEEGLHQLNSVSRHLVDEDVPRTCRREIRFLISGEISLIYKKLGRTRKVHYLILLPHFEAARKLNLRLSAIGNLQSDGRPILALDSRDLLEICLEACEDVLFIPAHIWTPHFAVLGARSGFDSLDECFEDLLPHIFAVETGLSSDPAMNGGLSMLDRYALVSNSDAHSPQKLAREATCFDTDLSYSGIYRALADRGASGLSGTIEFYPEEGKYHLDGHRKCGFRCTPAQTRDLDGVCPACGKALTVGVLHRLLMFADRPASPASARPFEHLIPLTEILGSVLRVGPSSKRVKACYERLLRELGPELAILRETPLADIVRSGEPLIAEGLRRMRRGEVEISPGFDGVYGKISVGELQAGVQSAAQ